MIRTPRRVGAAVALSLRGAPGTVGYVVVLLAVHAWMVSSEQADAFVAWASTNLVNLGTHPFGALAASGLIVNGALTDPGTVITFWLGVVVALGWLEARYGALRAGAVYLGGHVGATLLIVPVILAAIRAGRYPDDVATAVDVGISYGAQAALAAVVVTLPWWAWAPGALFVLGWPLFDADWSGLLPDFTTVGHLVAAGIGAVLGVVLLRTRRSTS